MTLKMKKPSSVGKRCLGRTRALGQNCVFFDYISIASAFATAIIYEKAGVL